MTIICKVKSKLISGLLPLSVSEEYLTVFNLTPETHVEKTIEKFNSINVKAAHIELVEIVSITSTREENEQQQQAAN